MFVVVGYEVNYLTIAVWVFFLLRFCFLPLLSVFFNLCIWLLDTSFGCFMRKQGEAVDHGYWHCLWLTATWLLCIVFLRLVCSVWIILLGLIFEQGDSLQYHFLLIDTVTMDSEKQSDDISLGKWYFYCVFYICCINLLAANKYTLQSYMLNAFSLCQFLEEI